ncbi:hypothetical protein [Clostridium sp. AM46-21]|uniref:hypothetical protein n=1 Tax=Clostridium sp. AM46-21 TaxID=2293033 RepID=UPI00269C60F1
MPWWGWMLIVIAILVVILVVLYIVGNRLQKKQSAQKEAMLQAAQPVTMLVIDKKMLPMKDANLPKQVLESTPKRYQKAKLPIVKAKIGPQIINLICDDGSLMLCLSVAKLKLWSAVSTSQALRMFVVRKHRSLQRNHSARSFVQNRRNTSRLMSRKLPA